MLMMYFIQKGNLLNPLLKKYELQGYSDVFAQCWTEIVRSGGKPIIKAVRLKD